MSKVINVSEPWFNYICTNKKTIEGRLNKGNFSLLKKDDIIYFKNNNKECKCKIKKIVKYNTFKEYLSQEGLKRTLPNVKTIKEGLNIYYKYYTFEDELKYGILAIYIKVIQYI